MSKGRIIILAIGIAAFWPWLGSPSAYAHWKDRFRTSVPVALLFGAPCETREGQYIQVEAGPNCYRYDSPRVFKGIWRDEFEGFSFFEGRTSVPANNSLVNAAWLSFSTNALATTTMKAPGKGPSAWVEIEFLGRKTSQSGAHGHFGMWPNAIIVDKIIAYRPIESRSVR